MSLCYSGSRCLTQERKKNSSLALNTIDLVHPLGIRQTKVLKVHFLLMEKGQDIASSNCGNCFYLFIWCPKSV